MKKKVILIVLIAMLGSVGAYFIFLIMMKKSAI